MPPKKVCKKKIRFGSKWIACGAEYTGDVCPQRVMHQLPFKSGYCNSGWCEGFAAKSSSGAPAPTCKFYMTCPCDCHQLLWQMFEMSEMERILVDKSEYHPAREFWMPSDDPSWDHSPLSSGDTGDAPVLVESPVPDTVPATLRRSYAPTATGRAARGELESWVKEQCDIWLIERYDYPCTPVWIAEEIAGSKAIKAPSVGAISAVFDRWVKLGFAVIEKKPTRFVRYTDEGVRLGLDQMKERAKRKTKLAEAEKKRNLIR